MVAGRKKINSKCDAAMPNGMRNVRVSKLNETQKRHRMMGENDRAKLIRTYKQIQKIGSVREKENIGNSVVVRLPNLSQTQSEAGRRA